VWVKWEGLFVPCGVLKSILCEKEALEFSLTAAQGIIQLYLTSAALKVSLGSLASHVFFSDSYRRVGCLLLLI